MSLRNLNPVTPIADADIPATIARDAETAAAINAHLNAADPHLQYATQARGDARYTRYFNSFEETIAAPINLTANAWQALGSARVWGELGKGAMWDIGIYFQYTDQAGGPNQPYFQYFGTGTIGAIFWQADHLTNQGIEIPFECHDEADFTARIRLGRGQTQLRKLEIAPSRAISIVAPGFGRITGLRTM